MHAYMHTRTHAHTHAYTHARAHTRIHAVATGRVPEAHAALGQARRLVHRDRAVWARPGDVRAAGADGCLRVWGL